MKKLLITTVLFCFTLNAMAQDLPGFRTGRYNGVLGVYTNPANTAQNNYKWDVSLFSTVVSVGNNNASFGLKNLSEITKGDSLMNQLIGKDGKSSNALLGVDIKPLSIMIGLNRKSGIALTTRARIMANATNIDGTLGKQITDQNSNASLPYTVSSTQDMRVVANAWSEFGFTYGTVILDKNTHFMKIGVTAKYLAGVANAYANVNKLNGKIDEDPVTNKIYLQNATGSLEIGNGGVSLDNFEISELTSFKSTGFGADLGFVYEWRPGYKTGDVKKGNKYQLRVGASLSDVGSIKYQKNINNSAGYKINITGTDKLDFEELGNQELDNLKPYLDSKPNLFTPQNSTGSQYSVQLPTMMNLDIDYKLKGSLYVNAAAQINLNQTKTKLFNSSYYNSYTATARIETKNLGLYVPLNYSELTDLNAGIALKLGPLFIGSGSVLTALMSSSKQVDLFFGLRFGAFAK